jgi:hypothetical protein
MLSAPRIAKTANTPEYFSGMIRVVSGMISPIRDMLGFALAMAAHINRSIELASSNPGCPTTAQGPSDFSSMNRSVGKKECVIPAPWARLADSSVTNIRPATKPALL